MALDLRRHLNNEPVLAGPPSATYRARKFVRRHRIGVAAAVAAVMMLVAFAALTAVQARRIASERDRANVEAATARRVSDFLVGLFRVADPSETRGRNVTAREILDRGAAELEKLRDQPDIQARLQATIGSVYTGLGAYSDAGALLEQAVATRRRVLGPRSSRRHCLHSTISPTCSGSRVATTRQSRFTLKSSSAARRCSAMRMSLR